MTSTEIDNAGVSFCGTCGKVSDTPLVDYSKLAEDLHPLCSDCVCFGCCPVLMVNGVFLPCGFSSDEGAAVVTEPLRGHLLDFIRRELTENPARYATARLDWDSAEDEDEAGPKRERVFDLVCWVVGAAVVVLVLLFA